MQRQWAAPAHIALTALAVHGNVVYSSAGCLPFSDMEAYLAGGPVMYVLTVLSVVAVSLILYASHSLRSMRREPGPWMDRVQSSMASLGDSHGAQTQAIERICFSTHSAILWLSRLASMATLLGLLGTVLGISQAFADMQVQGQAGPDVFAAGIYQALHTTIAGLMLALPFLLAHHLLKDALAVRQLDLLSQLKARER